MMGDLDYSSAKDKISLRKLAARIAEIAAEPVMDERRKLWKKQKSLNGERPMVLAETSGVLEELPLDELECESEWARGIERSLRTTIYHHEQVDDDRVVEPRIAYGNIIKSSDYGVEVVVHQGDNGSGHGSFIWDAPLKNLPADLAKLKFRTHEFDREATDRQVSMLHDVFDGILPVVNKNWYWWTQGLTNTAINLLGLQEFMMAMYDQPEGLHALMGFLRDDHLNTLDWFESNGLLTVNNEDDYIGSGSVGYTDLFPQSDHVAGKPARLKDMWGLSESQETVGVSPDLFEEFVFQYQKPVIEKFGLSYYGCCEPVDNRWHVIKKFSNLRMVSVSPWADQEKMARYLGGDYVFSRKPNPAFVSTLWNEDVLRDDIRKTLDLTKGMNVELVMKDVHTLCNEPWRLGRWVQIAREEIAK